MSDLLVLRKKIQEFYARKSMIVDRGLQFLLAVVTFFLINQNIGVMKMAASPVVTLGLAIVCTFLPPVFTALAAVALVLAHLFVISLGVMGVCAIIFVLMFIFYCRFSPNKALVILLTPLAFWLHIPYVVPILCGLVLSPIAIVPVSFGTVAYYMISYVKDSSAALASVGDITGEMTLFLKSVFQNKELWIMLLAFSVSLFAVYAVKRRSIDHAWKVAIGVGIGAGIIIIAVGNIVMNTNISYTGLIVGNIIASVIGIVLEFFVFSVDYTRTEHLQFEDDEYYYYVKAVPKNNIAEPKKTVKTINERKNEDEMEEIRRRRPKKVQNKRPVKRSEDTERVLLERSLNSELGIHEE